MNNTQTPTTDDVRFPSLDAMRAAYRNLLKRQRDKAKTSDLRAEAEAFILKGRATGALLAEDNDRQAAQGFLDYWSTRLYRPGYEPPDATLAEFDSNLAPELDDALCPYVGLEAFGETNKGVFFGRTRLVKDLVARLKKSPLLVVLGPSGSGKSSLVQAGLIPALKSGALPDSAGWHYFPPIVPGSNPLANLSELTRPSNTDSAEWAGEQVKLTLERPGHLTQLIASHFTGGVVIVVNRFEEAFTLCADDGLRQTFVDSLVSLTNAGQVVILTMRTDFEAQVARLPDFQKLFEQAAVRVGPLNAGELREAIEAPAAMIGLKFEEGVVDDLLNDLLGEPAALPLLQFTLLKLWERRDHNQITWEAYRKLGGGRQALANTADELYNNLTPEEQATAKRMLLKMVKPGEGAEMTSNRVRRGSLYHKDEANDRVDGVLDKLIRAHLVRMTPGESGSEAQVEIAHEALLRNWPRLVDWLDEERITLRQRHRLTAAAEQWLRLSKDPSALRRGALLAEALQYDDLNLLEAEFVKASRDAEEAAERHKEAIRQRELDDARRIAEVEKQRAEEQEQAARRLRLGNRIITAVGVVAVILAIAAAFFGNQANIAAGGNATLAAMNAANAGTAQAASTQAVAQQGIAEAASTQAVAQKGTAEAASTQAVAQQATAESERDRADKNSQLALSRQLALQALDLAGQQPGLALLLSVEANRLTDTDDVKNALLGVFKTNPTLLGYFYGHTDPVTGVALSADSTVLASGDETGTIILWDVATGQQTSQLTGHTGGITGLDFSADGKQLASSSLDGTARLWDVASRAELARPDYGDAPFEFTEVLGVAFRANNRTLRIIGCARPAGTSAACNNLYVWQWDIVTGQRTGGLLLYNGEILPGLTFRADEKMVAYSRQNKIILANVTVGPLEQIEPRLDDHTDEITGLAFGLDGQLLASSSLDNTVRLWDVNRRKQIGLPLVGHRGAVRSVAFSAGDTFVSGGDDNAVILWSAPTIQPNEDVSDANNFALLNARACQTAGRNLTQAEWAQYLPGTLYRKTCEQWAEGE
ncbi:MAG: hypothetical protein HYZ49_19590 [Chloroflexi bacterium]|nr:hypothetical protein [Chloroflexota bacterium]